MALNWIKLSRKLHYWGALIVLLPALVIFITGILLHLKKDINWIQPPLKESEIENYPIITFDKILSASVGVKEANIKSWADISRLDVRPEKGIVKVKAKNHWEVQIDTHTGSVVQVAYRRSDIIEKIHDGSWFHVNIKYWLFFPVSVILLILWVTGIYMIFFPYVIKSKKNSQK